MCDLEERVDYIKENLLGIVLHQLLDHDGLEVVEKAIVELKQRRSYWPSKWKELRQELDKIKESRELVSNAVREANMLIEQRLKSTYPDIAGFTFPGKVSFIIDKLLER